MTARVELSRSASVEDRLRQQGELGLLSVWREQQQEQAILREQEAPVWQKVGPIMMSNRSSRIKANLIGDIAKDPKALIYTLDYFADTFPRVYLQDEWRETLRFFGDKALPRIKRSFLDHLSLIARAFEVDSVAFLTSRESPYSHFLSDLLKGNGKDSRGLTLEEKCNVLVEFCPAQSGQEVVKRYCGRRPGIRQQLDEFRLNIQAKLQKDQPAFDNLTARDISFYIAVAQTVGWSQIEMGEGLTVDLAGVAIRQLNSYKDEAIASGREKDLFGKYARAMGISTIPTQGLIRDCLIGWGKPNSPSLRAIVSPFLDDIFNTVIDRAMSEDEDANSLIVSVLACSEVQTEQQNLLPIVEQMIRSGNFPMDKIAYIVRKYIEAKGAVLDPDLINNEELISAAQKGDIELQVSLKEGVRLIFPDGTSKQVGHFVKKPAEPVAPGNGKQKAEAVALTAVAMEVPTPEPPDPVAAAMTQITELLQQDGIGEKSEDEVLDWTDQKWAEIYGPQARRTKTLNPRGSVLRLFPTRSSQAAPRVEFTYTYNSLKSKGTVLSEGIALSDLQGALILSDDLRFLFVLAHDGILMDNGGDIFAGLVEYDLGTYLRLNNLIVSRAVDALIEPTGVLMQRADRIARRLNETEAVLDWERGVSEQVRAKIPERFLRMGGTRIRQYQDMLFIEYGSAADDKVRRLAAHEISEILNGGEVSMISEERPLTSQDIDQLNIRRGAKITPNLEGKGVRIGSLRWLGPRRDGSPMLPTLAAIDNVRTNFPNNRLMIRKVYEVDTMEDDGGGVRTFAPVTVYSTWQSPVYR